MSEKITKKISLKDARLIFKNFSGEKSEYNDEGNRNFGVLLDDELAEMLADDGWRVKRLRPREDDPDGYMQPWLPVKVKFGKYPPIINLISDQGTVRLEEDTIGQLDWTYSKHVELVIRPYNYPALKGRPAGVSAYLESMDYTKDEGEFYGR